MDLLKAIILGIVQGVCEFFPISSSAHLNIFKLFLNLPTNNHLFDLVCHLGTVLASLIFLRKNILDIFKNQKEKLGFIFLAILPLVFIYFLFKPFIEKLSTINYLPYTLLITSFILFYASKEKKIKKEINNTRKIKDVLLIGIMQGLALIPGISRSGSTISSACIRGWKIEEAVTFSFLLSIPTILGGMFLESIKLCKTSSFDLFSSNFFLYFTSFSLSFLIGSVTIRYIFKIKSQKKLKIFAYYLLVLSTFLIIFFKLIKI